MQQLKSSAKECLHLDPRARVSKYNGLSWSTDEDMCRRYRALSGLRCYPSTSCKIPPDFCFFVWEGQRQIEQDEEVSG